MSVTVTMRIFSGRKDPSWELDDEQIAELKRRLASAYATSLLKPPGLRGRLGYSGFTIRSTWEPGLEPEIFVDRGFIDIDRFAPTHIIGSELELWLLRTGSQTINPDLLRYVADDIGAARYFDPRMDKDPPFKFLLEPPYDPGKWNSDPTSASRIIAIITDAIRLRTRSPNQGEEPMLRGHRPRNVPAPARLPSMTGCCASPTRPRLQLKANTLRWSSRHFPANQIFTGIAGTIMECGLISAERFLHRILTSRMISSVVLKPAIAGRIRSSVDTIMPSLPTSLSPSSWPRA